jgi:peptidoglycan-N-acetylglucosamine deacetylase
MDQRRSDPSAERAPNPSRSGSRRRELALRRRRAAALGIAALVALVVGLVVGGSSGGGSHGRSVTSTEVGFLSEIKQLAGNGAHSFAASQRAEENAAINKTLSYTPYVRMAGTQHRELALTFDDGPGPYTPQILKILRRTHTAATFFEIGEELQYFYDATKEIVSLGYPIGDHTETHPDMADLSEAQQQAEILDQTKQIGRYGASFPRMFRPPYGDWNETTLQLLRKYHMLMVLWSVDTQDWELPGTQAIIHAVLAGAKPGAIILMHDAGGTRTETVDALPTIIRDLRARGYKLVTVPQLLLDNPAPKQQDVASVRGEGG